MHFEWFKNNASAYSLFLHIAKTLLCEPPKSVDSERLFSKATLEFSNKLLDSLLYRKVEQLLLIIASEKTKGEKRCNFWLVHLIFRGH